MVVVVGAGCAAAVVETPDRTRVTEQEEQRDLLELQRGRVMWTGWQLQRRCHLQPERCAVLGTTRPASSQERVETHEMSVYAKEVIKIKCRGRPCGGHRWPI